MGERLIQSFSGDNGMNESQERDSAVLRPAPTEGGVALVILAAGAGTRMRSDRPKLQHPVAGLPMISHVLRAGAGAEPIATVMVVSPATSTVATQLELGDQILTVVQDPPRGTGDAAHLEPVMDFRR